MPALRCRTEERKNYFELEKMLLDYTAVVPFLSPPNFLPPQKTNQWFLFWRYSAVPSWMFLQAPERFLHHCFWQGIKCLLDVLKFLACFSMHFFFLFLTFILVALLFSNHRMIFKHPSFLLDQHRHWHWQFADFPFKPFKPARPLSMAIWITKMKVWELLCWTEFRSQNKSPFLAQFKLTL